MGEGDLAPILPLLPKRATAGRETAAEPLPVRTLDQHNPIGDIAQDRQGVRQPRKMAREEAEGRTHK